MFSSFLPLTLVTLLLTITAHAQVIRPLERPLERAAIDTRILNNTVQPAPYPQPQPQLQKPVYREPLPPKPIVREQPPRPVRDDTRLILTLIENQISAIQSNNLAAAYDSYTAIAFRNKTSLDEFKFFITSYPVFHRNKNAYFGCAEFAEDHAEIGGTLTDTEGKSAKVDYFLTNENGEWKILGIQIDKTAPPPADFKPTIERHYDFQKDIEHKPLRP